jgi:hypothetical protein
MDERLISLEKSFETEMLHNWDFSNSTPMSAALCGFRSGYKMAEIDKNVLQNKIINAMINKGVNAIIANSIIKDIMNNV